VKTRNSRPFRSVLVPLDGSPLAEQAIPLALEIARAARSKVRLLFVHQSPPPPFYEESAELYVAIDLATRKAGRRYLQELAAQLRERSGLPISAVVIDGSIPQALVKYVQDSRADLVAMTTHGRGGVRGAWLGSVADHLVRSLEVPVIVTRVREGAGSRSAPPKIRKIMVPLDGSPLAEAALTPAAAMAGLLAAELVLVQVVPPLPVGSVFPDTLTPGYGTDTPGYGTEIVALERKGAQKYLEGLSQDLPERGTRFKTTVVVGPNVGEALIKLAHQERIDLVAIATHGRSGVRRLMLGSVADKLIRAAAPPVLVIRPKKSR
jgi:nucleotide-binding universal stress UspA family protein